LTEINVFIIKIVLIIKFTNLFLNFSKKNNFYNVICNNLALLKKNNNSLYYVPKVYTTYICVVNRVKTNKDIYIFEFNAV